MIVLHPVSGGFIRLAGKWVDDALGFMVGWNFFFYEALLIPFEITALNLVIQFWTDKIPVAAVCVVSIILYGYVPQSDYFWPLALLRLLYARSVFSVSGNVQAVSRELSEFSSPESPFKMFPYVSKMIAS